MNLPDGVLHAAWAWIAGAAFLAFVAAAGRTADWRPILSGRLLHVYAGSIVAAMVLWSITGNVGRGLSFHLLGATVLTMMFGARLAVIGLSVALAGVSLAGHAGWEAAGINGLLMIGLPVATSHVVHRLIEGRLPNHFFVYIFGACFLNGALAMGANGLASTVTLWLAGAKSGAYLFTEYLPYYLLLAWGEGLVTGMLMTMLVVYRPRWVATFDDARYLVGH